MDNDSMLGNVLGALVNNRNGDWGGYGGGGFMWIIVLLFLMGIGGGGFGWGNRGGFGGGFPPDVATKDDVYAATAWQSTQSKIDSQTQQINALGLQGLSSANAIDRNVSQQGADTRLDICKSTGTITNGQAQVGFLVQNGNQQIERAVDQARFESQQQTCTITSNDTANTQKVLDKLCQMEANMQTNRINELTVANQALSLQNAMSQQTAQIVGAVRPFPVPAYLTASPYAGYGYGYGYGPGLSYGNFT